MATCIRCGSELSEGERSCSRCGGRPRASERPAVAPAGTWSEGEGEGASERPRLKVHPGGAGGDTTAGRAALEPSHRSPPDRSPLPVAHAATHLYPERDDEQPQTGSRPRIDAGTHADAHVVPLTSREEASPGAWDSGERPTTAARGDEPSGQRRTSSHPPPPETLPARPPVLASESLREDIAPTEPGRKQLRWLGLGAGLLGAAAAPALGGLDPLVVGVSAVLLLVAAASAVPLRYGMRAMVLLGLAIAGGAAATAVRIAEGAPLESPVLAAGTLVLAGGLLFRSLYRASQLARGLVGAGMLIVAAWLALAGGFDGLSTLDADWQSWGPAAVRVTFGLLLLLSLLAFMSPNSTGGTGVWAVSLLLAYASHIALQVGEALRPQTGPAASLPDPSSAIAVAVTVLVIVGAVALAQSAAVVLGGTSERRKRDPDDGQGPPPAGEPAPG